jgi:glycosyltransferase involved in cell wall biosynthesis
VRILMLSWRYMDHPQAGGAEVVTHECLRRLVAAGHDVTCFTAGYRGAAPEDESDGVRLVRRGRQTTVHAHALRWLWPRRNVFDRVVDQINTIPFFTPWYVDRERRRFLIYQLARGYWFRETRGATRLIAPIGWAAEPMYLRLYRRTDGITISRSTVDDLARLGVARERVRIIPMAVPFPPLPELSPKGSGWRLVVVGRLTPAKHVEEALRAFHVVRAALPDATLDVVGAGDERYRARLARLVADQQIRGVVFHGRTTDDRKLELLRESHIHVFCSHREGWGLTVTEAGAMGTPTVGYDVPGVRDSIDDPRQLVRVGDVEGIAQLLRELHGDRRRYDDVRRMAWQHAHGRSYEDTAAAFASAIEVRPPLGSETSLTDDAPQPSPDVGLADSDPPASRRVPPR